MKSKLFCCASRGLVFKFLLQLLLQKRETKNVQELAVFLRTQTI